jgi:acyl carrier protein
MDENEKRLAECFLSVFPDLTTDSVVQATSTSVESWDSVATVTLLAVVEEEFGINMDVGDLARFDSFNGVLDFLREKGLEHTGSSPDSDVAV